LELKDEEYARGYNKEIGVKSGETESSKSQGEVVCRWCLVCGLAEEIANRQIIKYHRDCPRQADQVYWPPIFHKSRVRRTRSPHSYIS
jgi:hypothetical protein